MNTCRYNMNDSALNRCLARLLNRFMCVIKCQGLGDQGIKGRDQAKIWYEIWLVYGNIFRNRRDNLYITTPIDSPCVLSLGCIPDIHWSLIPPHFSFTVRQRSKNECFYRIWGESWLLMPIPFLLLVFMMDCSCTMLDSCSTPFIRSRMSDYQFSSFTFMVHQVLKMNECVYDYHIYSYSIPSYHRCVISLCHVVYDYNRPGVLNIH